MQNYILKSFPEIPIYRVLSTTISLQLGITTLFATIKIITTFAVLINIKPQMTKYFHEHTKLADAITTHPELIQLLPRFGISLGFGDKSIQYVCKEYSVPLNLFITICNIYAFDSYLPTETDIVNTDTRHLISYLKKSHQHYFECRIPHIEKHLNIIAAQISNKQGSILKSFFNQFKKEVRTHFDYEEKDIFPTLLNLNKGLAPSYEFNGYEEAHSNIEDTLSDLIQIVFKYLPPNVEHENSIGMAFDILQLADDIKKHALIEELILVPFINHLERRHNL